MHILSNTPSWVYILVIALIFLGLRATKPRTVPFSRLVMIPSILTLWNVAWLFERTQEEFHLFFYWLLGIGVGAVIGWITVRHWKIIADRHRKTIHLPGTWTTLILILLVFVIRYSFVYNYEVSPDTTAYLFPYDALASGAITGIFIGRTLDLYRKYVSYYR